MGNLSAYLAYGNVSRATLLLEARTRAKLGLLLWPAVSEAIANLRKIGKWLSDLEIRRAIDSGQITDMHRDGNPIDCWLVTLIGLDSEGEALGVIFKLPVCRTEVIQVTEAFYFPGEFEPEDGVQWW